MPTPDKTLKLGLDFGTTNSVVVLAHPDGKTETLRFTFPEHPISDTCRTLLCFWQEEVGARIVQQEAIGAAAIDAYLEDPADSRMIMSMKSYLAQKSFRETQVFSRRLSLEALIAHFLANLMKAVGVNPDGVHVTVGRPVEFAGDFPDDALGEQRLRDSFKAAGFSHVTLAWEPEAAGWRFAQRLTEPTTILVGDFGGGTSDFSVMRFDPANPGHAEPLGHAGVGIAGDQFDYRIINTVIAPLLGRDCTYRVMGGEPLPVPIEWYASLGRWHRLALMRTPQTLRAMEDVARTVSDPAKLRALIDLVQDQQGQALYRAVGAAKSALSKADSTELCFQHRGFHVKHTITRADFESWIAPDLLQFDRAVDQALENAGLPASAVDRVFLTGGTSFVPAVRRLFTDRFGQERVDTGGEFVSVAEGLALMNGHT
ncbi:Hsp70 family protein [Acetobacter cibinongensis]|uniref:Molecular chaperone DnaK n=1 Tax=Acetobacter cibinongensis TaxID=146475 RepID=A0A1Z5YVE0_9PROT|nr:Hsp70 family protein [Acetobacter cibinongensis]OUJ02774.1 molecular chaperone DnaK [Acetobacter cibinongensis]